MVLDYDFVSNNWDIELLFFQDIEQVQEMFPSMDKDVIRTVLTSNGGSKVNIDLGFYKVL